jgi:hypothetical protein
VNKLLLLALLASLSFAASADVPVTITLGAPVMGVPVDEVLLWCDPVDASPGTPISLLDMSDLTWTYTCLPDGETQCVAQAVSNVNIVDTPSSSVMSIPTVFEIANCVVVKKPNATGPVMICINCVIVN